MSVLGPIFLSASVPIKGRQGYDSSEVYLIKEAVSALIEVILGRSLLVWGGQPAITPMIWEAAKSYEIPYERVVQLYQSKFFEGSYPEENIAFPNFIETEAIAGDMKGSLLQMRRQMLSDHRYSAAVFIGGMEGVVEEHDIFQELNPGAKIIPIASPGGVSRELFERHENLPNDFRHAIDYSFWLYELLEIDMLSTRKHLL